MSFPTSLAVGASAILLLTNLLTPEFTVTSVEEDPAYQAKGIDLLVNSPKGSYTYEVKGDSYDTGNYFFEVESNTTKETPGWLHTCQADRLAYVLLKKKEVHILPMDLTRQWVYQNLESFRSVKASTGSMYGNGILYQTRGLLVPIKTLILNIPTTILKTGDF